MNFFIDNLDITDFDAEAIVALITVSTSMLPVSLILKYIEDVI